MIGKSVKFAWSLLVIAAVTWFVFFVPLGERTLFQHVMRISQTEEAQDLGREAVEAGRRVSDEAREAYEEAYRDRMEREMAEREQAEGAEGEAEAQAEDEPEAAPSE